MQALIEMITFIIQGKVAILFEMNTMIIIKRFSDIRAFHAELIDTEHLR